MVIWIIGMSASGKTKIGKSLYKKLLSSDEKWFFLDGDTFRNIFGEDIGHSIEDRKKNAYRISRFCEYLSSQNINVVACVLSIFHDNQQYNKDNILGYKEIYLDVDFDKLIERDNKQLYTNALKGNIKNVVGVDIKFKAPFAPDFTIDNNTNNPNFEKIINSIIEKFSIKINEKYKYSNENLLEHPQKYQYSDFEGKDFFLNFKNSRENATVFFNDRLEYLKSRNQICTEIKNNEYIINNNLILKPYLTFLLESNKNVLIQQEETISFLIKRFEVSKKLYLTYDLLELKKSSLKFKEYINYPLFSLVLQKYYNLENSKEKQLVYFNSILKLNDIIISIQKDIILSNEISLCIKALKLELEITRSYT